MLEKITQRTVEKLRNQAQQQGKDIYCWCTDFTGFGFRASAKGRSSFLVQKWINGKAKRIVVGHYPVFNADAARKEAIGHMANLWRIVQSSHLSPENLSRDKLGPTFDRWYTETNKAGKHAREIRRCFTVDILPQLGAHTYVKNITKGDIRNLILSKQIDAPTMGRVIFSVLNPFFSWCVEQEIISKSPMDGTTRPAVSRGRDRYLTAEEIAELWSAAEKLGYPYGTFYQFALLTGQRNQTEIALMKWSEVQGDVWTIPSSRTKNKLEHIVHLPALAVALLDSIPRNSEYVFDRNGKPINGFASSKDKLDVLLSFNDFVVHDFRRTIVTHMVALGVKPDVSDRILNHVSKARSGVAGVYQKFEFIEERKDAMARWGSFIERAISTS